MRGCEGTRVDLEQAEIIQVDVLDRSYILVLFSNGVSAQIRSEDVRQLVISSAVQIVEAAEAAAEDVD